MESKCTQIKGLSESRFGSVILLFRLAGIPFGIKRKQTLYSIYKITASFCECSTFVGMFGVVYLQTDDLRHTVTNIRVLIAMTDIVWIWLYCR
jgi:hypothetical protein